MCMYCVECYIISMFLSCMTYVVWVYDLMYLGSMGLRDVCTVGGCPKAYYVDMLYAICMP